MDLQLDELIQPARRAKKPSWFDRVCYLFLDKGVTWDTLSKLPIPYIIAMLKVHIYEQEQSEKKLKESKDKNAKRR